MADPSYLAEGTLTECEAWVAIETTTLGAKAVNIGFTSGTGTKNWSQYEHLVLISSTRTDTGSNTDYVRLMLNGPSVAASGTYDDQWMGVTNGTVGKGASTSSTQGFMGYTVGGNRPSDIFGGHMCVLYDINSGKYKHWMSKGASVSECEGYSDMWSGIFHSQDPITSLYVSCYPTGTAGLWEVGSTAWLFGVLPKMVTV